MTKAKPQRVVTFVGDTDLAVAEIIESRRPLRDGELGPIWRFVTTQINNGELRNGDCILLLDDKPDDKKRESYEHWLNAQISSIGVSIDVKREELSLGNKPTDLKLLFEEVFPKIRDEGRFRTHFLLSPGTSSMYATLVLAAEYLRLKRPRLFQSSFEEGVTEVDLPYDIALRPRQSGRRAPNARQKPKNRLPDVSDVVLEDVGVQAAYKALYSRSKRADPVSLLIHGPSGSGKTHAASQIARWRDNNAPFFADAAQPPDTNALEASTTVIVRNLQAAEARWQDWRDLVVALPAVQFVFLFRTDGESSASVDDVSRDAHLANGGYERMPAFAERSDKIELIEYFARRAGKWDGKAKERFQYLLLKPGLAPRNLHELQAWVNSAASYSDERHLSEIAIERAKRQLDGVQAQGLLRRVARVVVEQSFIERVPLDTLLECVKALTVIVQGATGDAEKAMGTRLKIPRTTLTDEVAVAKRARALQEVLDAWPEWGFSQEVLEQR